MKIPACVALFALFCTVVQSADEECVEVDFDVPKTQNPKLLSVLMSHLRTQAHLLLTTPKEEQAKHTGLNAVHLNEKVVVIENLELCQGIQKQITAGLGLDVAFKVGNAQTYLCENYFSPLPFLPPVFYWKHAPAGSKLVKYCIFQ